MLAAATRYEKNIPPDHRQVNQVGPIRVADRLRHRALLQKMQRLPSVFCQPSESLHFNAHKRIFNYNGLIWRIVAVSARAAKTLSKNCYS
jgi:hypothetical protein